jgi:hypothetical protein
MAQTMQTQSEITGLSIAELKAHYQPVIDDFNKYEISCLDDPITWDYGKGLLNPLVKPQALLSRMTDKAIRKTMVENVHQKYSKSDLDNLLACSRFCPKGLPK